jgi:hypothetical protein
VSKIALLTPDAQSVIHKRQHLVAALITVIPLLSLGLGIVGVFMIGLGLFKWHQRQAVRDKGEDLSVEKQRKELQQMSPAEVEEKAREEVESTEGQLLQAPAAQFVSPVNDFLNVESAVLAKVRDCYGPSVKSNQRLAGVEYDAIIRTGGTERTILEIKYIRKGFRQGWLTESVNSLAARTALYSNTFSQKARGVLLIVFAPSSRPQAQRMSEEIERFPHLQSSRIKGISIRTLEQDSIPSISCQELRVLLD